MSRIAPPLNRTALAVCLAAALAGGGCAVIAYLTASIHGPEKIPAKFSLPDEGRTLVLVDAHGSREMVKRLLSRALNKELTSRGLVGKAVPYDDVVALRMATPGYNRLKASEIGQKLNAKTVIHVHVTRFALKDEPQDVMWHGQIEARVKVVAVPLKRLWPRDRPAGSRVGPVGQDETVDLSPTYASKLTSVLCLQMADAVAKLFYEHEAEGVEKWGARPTGGPVEPQ